MLILVAAPKQHRTAARALESCRGCCHSTEDSEASPNRSGRSSKQTTMSTVLLKLDESYWAPPPFKGFHTECSEIFWTCQRCRRGTTNTTETLTHIGPLILYLYRRKPLDAAIRSPSAVGCQGIRWVVCSVHEDLSHCTVSSSGRTGRFTKLVTTR